MFRSKHAARTRQSFSGSSPLSNLGMPAIQKMMVFDPAPRSDPVYLNDLLPGGGFEVYWFASHSSAAVIACDSPAPQRDWIGNAHGCVIHTGKLFGSGSGRIS